MTDVLTPESRELEALRDEVAEIRAGRAAPVRAGHEFTYREDNAQVSYIADRVLKHKNPAARERLQRHAQEMDGLRKELERRAPRPADLADGEPLYYEPRVNPSLVTGQGGELAPPAWVIDKFATAPRAGRVLADLSTRFPLPPHVQSVNLPRMTTGNLAGWQGNDNTQNPEQDVLTAGVSSEVVTISGQGDVALQLLEQSPVGAHTDWAWFKDLGEAYDYALEQQLLIGTGTNTITAQSQLPGILNLTGSTAISYTAAVTADILFPYLGQVSGAIGKNRHLPPELWMLTTARWSWLMSSEDSSLRPFEMPSLMGAKNVLCPGSIIGWDAYCNDAIPTTITAGTVNNYTSGNQDVIIACRPSDIFVFEANPASSTNLEVLSGALEARLIFRNYVAALTGRQPGAVAYLSGTGMVPAY